MQQILKDLGTIATELDRFLDPYNPGRSLFYLDESKKLCMELKYKIGLLNLISKKDSILQININEIENLSQNPVMKL